MTSSTKMGSTEAIFLVLSVMINHIILNLPKDILTSAGSASLLNLLYISLIVLGIIYLIGKLLKRFPGVDILDISEFLGGKKLKYVIGIVFIFYFLSTASIFLRSFAESLKLMYFQRTPLIFLFLLFIISIVITNKFGTNSLIQSNTLIMPIVLFSIIFIFFANIDNFTLQRMFPILGKGLSPTFFSGMSNIFAFGGIAYLYFIPPGLKNTNDYNKIAFTSMILSIVWLFLSVATLLFMFPSVANTSDILPLYFASRFIDFGRFLQRLDAIFLLIWIVSIISYLSIVMSFSVNVFKKITEFKYINIIIYVFATLLLLLSLIPRNSSQVLFLESHFYKFNVIAVNFVLALTILILANIKHKRKFKRKGDMIST